MLIPTSNRVKWIDYAKCILIFFMISGHCNINNTYHMFIYSFHMPAFFIISGYLLKIKEEKAFCFITKSIKSLLIPAIIYKIIHYVWYIIKGYVNNGDWNFLNIHDYIVKPILGFFIYDTQTALPLCGELWFVFILFFMKLIMYFIEKCKYYNIIYSIILTFCFIYPTIVSQADFGYLFLIKRLIVCFPFLLLGFKLKKQFSQIDKIPSYIIFILIPVILISIYLNTPIDIYYWNFGKSTTMFYINSFVTSICFFYLMTRIKCYPFIYKFILSFSIGTLLILGTHHIIMDILRQLHIKIAGELIPIVIMLLLYYPIEISRNKFKILIGK